MLKKPFTLLLLALGFIIAGCSNEDKPEEQLVAKGNKMYGGELKFMSTEKIDNLFPISTGDVYSSRIISQIFEPLLTIDPESGTVNPGIAKDWKLSSDARVYTFNIRKGVKFHEDDCFKNKTREVTAQDVKFSLDLACTDMKNNEVAYLLVDRIDGAKEHFDKSNGKIRKGGVKGIKAVNKHTLQITLSEPYVGFEKILTHSGLSVIPKEAYNKYKGNIGKHPVGTGPFSLESMSSSKIALKRNPKYWRKDEFGNRLPFLSKVTMTYVKNKRSELKAFRESKVDLVLELPVEETENILGTLEEAQRGLNVKHKVDAKKSLNMMYVAMQNESDEFSDVRVRKAFNMAIDRVTIVDKDLEGEGWPAKNGFVADIEGYPSEKVIGHDYNPERAKSLMREAGYPNGAGFPELDFYVNAIEGSGAHRACQAIAKQLKENLNVNLNIVLCSLDERRAAVNSGKAKIWRAGWIADYPDPSNFLAQFYGSNIQKQSTMVNDFNYSNDSFDAIYEKALVETDDAKRMDLYVQCDQMVVETAPVMPIMTDDHIVIINARVRDFNATQMETLDLTDVYIKELRKNKKK
ncbi:MAG: ABC transporter substrate-binding protein [bacterium]|nr:ABC transporter substrate-binding protein [bacterium]